MKKYLLCGAVCFISFSAFARWEVDKTVQYYIDEPDATTINQVAKKFEITEPNWAARGKQLPKNILPSFDNPTPGSKDKNNTSRYFIHK